MNVQVREEIVAIAPAKAGTLARYAGAIADAEIDIFAIAAYDKADRGEFMLITSDNDATASILESLGADISRGTVVVLEVEDRSGALAEAADLLATAGINVDWIYATTGNGSRTMIVIKTPDPESTRSVLAG